MASGVRSRQEKRGGGHNRPPRKQWSSGPCSEVGLIGREARKTSNHVGSLQPQGRLPRDPCGVPTSTPGRREGHPGGEPEQGAHCRWVAPRPQLGGAWMQQVAELTGVQRDREGPLEPTARSAWSRVPKTPRLAWSAPCLTPARCCQPWLGWVAVRAWEAERSFGWFLN